MPDPRKQPKKFSALVVLALAMTGAVCPTVTVAQNTTNTPGGPTVTTDRQDYAPFSYVEITGAGFRPGETVSNQVVQIAGPNPGTAYDPWEVVADSNGNFVTTWYVFTEDLIGTTLRLTAVGLSSGLLAQTEFTDDAFDYLPDNVALTISAGGSNSFTQQVIAPSGNGTFSAVIKTPIGTDANPIPNSWISTIPTILNFDTTSSADTQSWVVVVSPPAGTPAGTYTGKIRVNPIGPGFAISSGTDLSVTVIGCSAPTLTCPNNVTTNSAPAACGQIVTFVASATGDPVPAIAYSPASGTSFPLGTNTVTVTASNSCGSTSCTFTVTVVDTTPPAVTLLGANPLTNQCHTAFVDPGATATDACAGPLAVVTNSTVNPNAPGVYTIRYSATDSSGNAATNTRTVYVVDTTPPTVTLLGAIPLTNECHTTFVDPGATATDACAGPLAVVTNSTVNPNVPGVYSIRYSATDPSGNAATNTRTVYVVDTTPPTVTLLGANPLTNECHTAFVDPGATASDTCAGPLAVVTNSTVNPNAPGVYPIRYSATDPSGNAATNTRTIYVVDTTPPAVTLLGANPLTNECHTPFVDPGATASDTCAGPLAVVTNSTVNSNAAGVYSIRYSATDPSGNAATNTRTVYVVDTTPPAVTMLGTNPLTNECHTVFVDPGATATDTCAGPLAVVTNSTVNPNAPGVYSIRYSATDPSGNAATNTRTVYVVDTTPPTVTVLGANPLTNECHTAFVDPGATATDACAGPLAVVTNSTVNPNVPGVYSIRYSATDPSGNSATNTRTIYVVDTTPPTVTLLGANPLTNECHTAFVDPGATASDTCAGPLAVVTNSTVNPNAAGVYSIRYSATDPSGNAATNTRTVYVVDTTPPTVTLLGANPLTNECHTVFVDPGATATDTCAGPLAVVTNSTVNPNAPGVYSIRYSATDPSGNAATNTRTVYVVDTTPPTVTLLGANPLTNECHTAFVDPGATASDTCAGPLAVVTNSTVNPNAPGVYSIRYSATDPSGNAATNTRTVYVVDTTPPDIHCPSNNIVVGNDPGQCSAVVTYVTNATDSCGLASFECSTPSGSAFPVGTTTVTCTAVDAATNTASCTFNVTVEDREAPRASCRQGVNPSGKNIPAAGKNPSSGQNPDGYYELLAKDNCDASPVIYVADSGSTFIAGPFANGDVIKLTQSPGRRPSQDPAPAPIVAHVHLKGDGVLYAVDAAGNQSEAQMCLVPRPPK